MPILGSDGQPLSLAKLLGTMALEDFPPLGEAGVSELETMTREALAGGVMPQNTVALPLAALAQLLMTLHQAGAVIASQDSARPPWMDALDAAPLGPPEPHTTRITYWQDGTLQAERWHQPDEGERVGIIAVGDTLHTAFKLFVPMEPVTLDQLERQGKLDPEDSEPCGHGADAVACSRCGLTDLGAELQATRLNLPGADPDKDA